jgi:beta-glucosidase
MSRAAALTLCLAACAPARDLRPDSLVARMTLDEKLQLVRGVALCAFADLSIPGAERTRRGAGFIPGIARLGIPDINLTDGPAGITNCGRRARGQSTALPSPLAIAASWDPDLAHDAGALIGREARAQGFAVVLSGGVNLAREPRGGRTFEYFGEDPLLAGTLVGRSLRGVQEQRVVGVLKHFVANEQENGRHTKSSIVDERTLRELYLRAFEIGLAESDAGAVLCSYNKVNGTFASENAPLLRDVLRREWGFAGWVMSDWRGTHSTVEAASAGLDEEEPFAEHFGDKLKAAVAAGQLPVARLDDMVVRKLRALGRIGVLADPPRGGTIDVAAGSAFAERAAEQSLVLLKNAGGLLPLDAARLQSVAVIGAHADAGVLSGGGSSQVSPVGGPAVPPTCNPEAPGGSHCPIWLSSSPLRAVAARAPRAGVRYADGSDLAAAEALARRADVAMVFVSQWSAEGEDLRSLSLGDQDELVRRVAAANPRTIVVLETATAVTMPWLDAVPAVLAAWYPGIGGGEAIARVLFGEVNPSGKLPLTFPRAEADLPSPAPPADADVRYDEGLLMGYRWFDAKEKTPLFPFGHGLSYTSFAFANLRAELRGGNLEVAFELRNTGARVGREVAQVYAALPAAAGEPPRRLVGWTKLELRPGETRAVSLSIPARQLAIWDIASHGWKVVPGRYTLSVGASSRDLRLQASVESVLSAR